MVTIAAASDKDVSSLTRLVARETLCGADA
jgi:hypothetical protein